MESATRNISFRICLDALGTGTMKVIDRLGAVAIFFAFAFLKIFRRRQIGEIIQQEFYIGAKSSNIVMLVALFTGMVLGLQLFYTLIKFGSEGVLGSVVALTLIRELGPVLTAIMITARAGSAMTAEIGGLRISEQIDALHTVRIDPTGVLVLGVNGGSFFYRIHSYVDMTDIRGGFIKSLVFAVIVSVTCCYMGYFTHLRIDAYGAKSVSPSTTSAVVVSCVMIL